MTTTWIIAADSSRARILQVTDREQRLDEIDDLLNPEGRVDDRQLTTDTHPRYSGHGGRSARGDAQAGDVVDQHVDLLLGERLRHLRHVAVDIGARATLKAAQLRAQVLRLLAGDARHVLLALQARAVALHAAEALRELE